MSAFYNNEGAKIVNIAHAGGVLTLDHRRGDFFEVTATGNITSIQNTNARTGASCIVRIKASGGTRTINFANSTSDPKLLSIQSLADGEFILAQGVDLPDLQ